MSRDRGACGLGRRGEERLRLGGARGLPGDDERGDHEQRADEEERRERAGAAGVRRGDVEAGPPCSALGPLRDGILSECILVNSMLGSASVEFRPSAPY